MGQDWNYENTNNFEITVELSYIKYVPQTQLEQEWLNNKEALIAYMQWVHRGVRGIVTDIHNEPITNAQIQVFDKQTNHWIEHHISTNSPHGDYYRILIPGFYSIRVVATGYEPVQHDIQVSSSLAVQLNFKLVP